MININCKTRIAILLGVYNGEKYIAEQLDSLLGQSYKNWTLYIRDDASVDKTREIITAYSLQHKEIVIVSDDDGNLGCNGNYFRLLSIVSSEYYMFCNADDYWYPFKIEICFNRMLLEESNSRDIPIIVHTDLAIADQYLNIVSESYWISVNTNPEKYKTYGKLGICSDIAGATMLFNRKVRDLTFPVSKYAPFFDHWIALKVVRSGHIATVHIPTIAYRQIGTNLSAVSIGHENSILAKILGIRKVISNNIVEAKMLKNIEWGGYVKYLFYKTVVLIMLRLGGRYKDERQKYL